MKIKLEYNPNENEWEVVAHVPGTLATVIARCADHADAISVRNAALEERAIPPLSPAGLTLEP